MYPYLWSDVNDFFRTLVRRFYAPQPALTLGLADIADADGRSGWWRRQPPHWRSNRFKYQHNRNPDRTLIPQFCTPRCWCGCVGRAQTSHPYTDSCYVVNDSFDRRAIKSRMSSARQAVQRADSLIGFGKRPDLTPSHQLVFPSGMTLRTCGKRRKPVSGISYISPRNSTHLAA